MADDAPALWDAILARGVTPCGLGARDTLRLEVCYPLHGNDIAPEWDAISGGPRLGLRARQGLHRRRAAARDQGARPRAQARRVPDDRAGDPAAGDGDRGRRRGDLRARTRRCSTSASGMGYVPAATSAPGTELTIDVRGRPRRARGRDETDLQARGVSVAASESYPDDLLYNREHDWARIEGDEAVLGITWYAARRARRARPLRAARGGRDDRARASRTARSSRSRPSRT